MVVLLSAGCADGVLLLLSIEHRTPRHLEKLYAMTIGATSLVLQSSMVISTARSSLRMSAPKSRILASG